MKRRILIGAVLLSAAALLLTACSTDKSGSTQDSKETVRGEVTNYPVEGQDTAEGSTQDGQSGCQSGSTDADGQGTQSGSTASDSQGTQSESTGAGAQSSQSGSTGTDDQGVQSGSTSADGADTITDDPAGTADEVQSTDDEGSSVLDAAVLSEEDAWSGSYSSGDETLSVTMTDSDHLSFSFAKSGISGTAELKGSQAVYNGDDYHVVVFNLNDGVIEVSVASEEDYDASSSPLNGSYVHVVQ